MDNETDKLFRPAREGFRWDDVAWLPYKQDGSAPFKDISRQVLFQEAGMGCECGISRWGRAATRRWSGMSTRMP